MGMRDELLVVRELISRCSLLRDLPQPALDSVIQKGSRRQLNARDVVFGRGEAGSDIYFLLDGGVKVATISRDGKEAIFDVLVSGDFFGEMSLFDGKPRTGTVTALVPSALFVLGKGAFLELLASHPPLSVRLVQTLVGRLRVVDDFVGDVLFLHAEARLAKRVVALARMFGRTGDQGEIRIDLRVSQQEIANLVGITRESVNKQFRGWERAGAISLDGGCLVLRQPQFLEAMTAEAG